MKSCFVDTNIILNLLSERNPFIHPRTWGMTLLMGIILNMIYFSIKIIKNKKVVLAQGWIMGDEKEFRSRIL